MPEGNSSRGKPRLNIFIPKKVTYRSRQLVKHNTLKPQQSAANTCQSLSPAAKTQSQKTRQAAQHGEQSMPLQKSEQTEAVTAGPDIFEALQDGWTRDQLRQLHNTLTQQLLHAAKCRTGSNISSRAESRTMLNIVSQRNHAEKCDMAATNPGIRSLSNHQPSSSSGSSPTRPSQGMHRHSNGTEQCQAVRADSGVANAAAVTSSVSAADTASKVAASSTSASITSSSAESAPQSTGNTSPDSTSSSSKAVCARGSCPSDVRRTQEARTSPPQKRSNASSGQAARSASPQQRSVGQFYGLKTSPAQDTRQSAEHSTPHRLHSRSARRHSTCSARQSSSPSKLTQSPHRHSRCSMAHQNASDGRGSPLARPSRAPADAGEPLKGSGGFPARRTDPHRQRSSSPPKRGRQGGSRVQRRRQRMSVRSMLNSGKGTSRMKPYSRRHAQAGDCHAIHPDTTFCNLMCTAFLLGTLCVGNCDGTA